MPRWVPATAATTGQANRSVEICPATTTATNRGGKALPTYKRAQAMQPTINHRKSEPVCDFVICDWRTIDVKHDMSIDELKEICRLDLEHNP